jgi:serine protease Do
MPLLVLWLNVCISPTARGESGVRDTLTATSRIVEHLTDTINPAVVEVDVKAWASSGPSESTERTGYLVSDHSLGAGILLTSTGEILTNHHVIRGAQQITVRLFGSDQHRNARMIGDDPEADLALLKIDGSCLPHFDLEKGGPAKQGQIVLAFGSPYGFDHSVSIGLVSSPSRQLNPASPTTYIQTDAPLNPGGSGGPLVDLNGQLIGINTMIYTHSGGSEGIGFALPIETVRYSVAGMEKHVPVRRPYLGISGQPVTEALMQGLQLGAATGLLVDDVDWQSPAARSGIRPGDVLLSMNGIGLRDMESMQQVLRALIPDKSVVLDMERDRARISVTVEPEFLESQGSKLLDYADVSRDSISQLGIIAVTMNSGILRLAHGGRFPDGAVVAGRYEETSSSDSELEAGDIIHQVNGHYIHDAAELRESLAQASASAALILQVERDRQLMYIAINGQH